MSSNAPFCHYILNFTPSINHQCWCRWYFSLAKWLQIGSCPAKYCYSIKLCLCQQKCRAPRIFSWIKLVEIACYPLKFFCKSKLLSSKLLSVFRLRNNCIHSRPQLIQHGGLQNTDLHRVLLLNIILFRHACHCFIRVNVKKVSEGCGTCL